MTENISTRDKEIINIANFYTILDPKNMYIFMRI